MPWVYSWRERCERKYPRPTGMRWRGGILSYRWPIGPRTQFWSVMEDMLKGIECLKICRPLPAAGKTIQFFTYKLEEPNAS